LPEQKKALDQINLEIGDNEFIGIIGPSGSGKTTLIQHFTGLLKPTSGKVFVNNADIFCNEKNINLIRRLIGVVFQFPESQLFEETVYDDLAFGPKNYGLSKEEINHRMKQIIKLVGLDFEKLKYKSPFKLSEGEKRRIAIASIMIMNPDVLIMDEPTACLDATGIKLIERLLIDFYKQGKTVVLVSHNIDFVLKICKRIIILQEGNIRLDRTINELLKNSSSIEDFNIEVPRTIRYCNKLNEIGYLNKKNLHTIKDIKKALSA